MFSAFGVDHGDISKAMSPNKLRGLLDVESKMGRSFTPKVVNEGGYARDKLIAFRMGRSAGTAPPKMTYPGDWMSASQRKARLGQKAARRAKIYEDIAGRRRPLVSSLTVMPPAKFPRHRQPGAGSRLVSIATREVA